MGYSLCVVCCSDEEVEDLRAETREVKLSDNNANLYDAIADEAARAKKRLISNWIYGRRLPRGIVASAS